MAKRVEDIEKALCWTYVHELPKRGRASLIGGYGSNYEAVERYGEQGTMVDEPLVEPGFPGELGDPHPDAYVIEQAVDSLKEIARAARDGTHTVALFDDDAGLGMEAFGIDAAPLIVRSLTQVRESVITHARLGTRPPVDDVAHPGPRIAKNNQPEVCRLERQWEVVRWTQRLDEHGTALERIPAEEACREVEVPSPPVRSGTYRPGAYCPLRWDPAPRSILMDRADYVVWRAALDLLASELSGQLESMDVTPPAAAMRPWEGECDATEARRIIRDLRADVRLRELRIEALAWRLYQGTRKRRKAA